MRWASGLGEAAKICLRSWWTTTRRGWRIGRGRMKRRVEKAAEADHQVYCSTTWLFFSSSYDAQVRARWGRQGLIFCQYLREERVRRKTRQSYFLHSEAVFPEYQCIFIDKSSHDMKHWITDQICVTISLPVSTKLSKQIRLNHSHLFISMLSHTDNL